MKTWKKTLNYLLLLTLALIVVFPVWLAVTSAFSSQWELEEKLFPIFTKTEETASWSLLPQAPTLQPMAEVLLDNPGFFTTFWNSVTISLGILAGQLVIAVPAAWVLAQFPIPGKKRILTLYILLMLMPFQVLMYPQYLVLKQLNLLDTLWAVIVPGVFSTFPVFLLHRFFLAIPREILEAARLDGAGEVRIFCQIAMPLSAPGILATMILSFLDSWNMIEQPMTYLKNKALWPLSLFLPAIKMEDMSIGFAAALLMLIPALLLFIGCQDDLQEGIALSGGKG